MSRPTSYNSSRFATKHPSWSNDSPVVDENMAHPATTRTVSASSGLSTGSVIRGSTRGPLRVIDVNGKIPSVSLSTLDLADGSKNVSQSRTLSSQMSRTSSWVTDIHSSQMLGETANPRGEADGTEDVGVAARCGVVQQPSRATSYEGMPDDLPLSGDGNHRPRKLFHEASTRHDDKAHPFRRWVSTLRRRNVRLRQPLRSDNQRFALDDFDERSHTPPARLRPGKHRKSSSSGFVTAMKSATASLITMSAAPQTWRPRHSSVMRRSNRSSGISTRFNRCSMEDRPFQVEVVDEASKHRASQRREIIDEIISSEEGYVTDLKVLVNASRGCFNSDYLH